MNFLYEDYITNSFSDSKEEIIKHLLNVIGCGEKTILNVICHMISDKQFTDFIQEIKDGDWVSHFNYNYPMSSREGYVLQRNGKYIKQFIYAMG